MIVRKVMFLILTLTNRGSTDVEEVIQRCQVDHVELLESVTSLCHPNGHHHYNHRLAPLIPQVAPST